MRRLFAAAAAAALCLTALTACANAGEFSDGEKLSAGYERKDSAEITYNYSDGATEPPNSYNTYGNGAAGLALKQLRARYQPGKSFAFSPASTALQLGMLANAASSDARQEILITLGGMSVDDLNACSSYFKSRMEAVSTDNEKGSVRLGGGLLIDDGIDVKSSFLQTAKNYYNYDVLRFDYSGENAAKKLENYLNTSAKLTLADGTLNLVSTLTVKDSWLDASGEAQTADFAGAGGSVQLPYYTANVKKLQTEKATGVLRYTANTPLKLLLVMPNEGVALDDYVKAFDTDELGKLMQSMDITKDDTAAIPEFSVTGGEAVPLSETLTKNGLYTLFTEKAKFASLSYNESAKMGEVYEISPTVAIGKNGVNVPDSKADTPAQTIKTDNAVTLNRPFIFLLLDNESDLPVLAGAFSG